MWNLFGYMAQGLMRGDFLSWRFMALKSWDLRHEGMFQLRVSGLFFTEYSRFTERSTHLLHVVCCAGSLWCPESDGGTAGV